METFLVDPFLVKRARLLQWLVFFLFLSDHRPHRVHSKVCTKKWYIRMYHFLVQTLLGSR